MTLNKENVHLLEDGEYYWVKTQFRLVWEIGKYDGKYKQFRFNNGSVSDIPTTKYVDPKPIRKPEYLN